MNILTIFPFLFFIKYANLIKDKSIVILFQETKDKRVVNFFRSYSILVTELEFNITILDTYYSVLCIKDGFYDSSLLITNKLEKILNLNDCEILSSSKASKIYAITGEVDILLSQFSYAAWKGGRSNIKWRKSAAKDKLNAISTQIKILRPKVFIPIASYMYFSNKNNFYLNDSINEPSDIIYHLKDSISNVIIMKPGDIFGSKLENYSNIHANEFWEEQYKSIHYKKLNEYKVVNEQIIFKSFHNYCERISKK
jgi:UDP-MurNAc hydroxylase